ncbi:hypothetical protein [Dapis sp. BLCC M172]|uniref:hypothetical protein n=1 Tax=Dapis sp. BLCC M172 TaxID=2975281 RepID=UPI003CFB32FE
MREILTEPKQSHGRDGHGGEKSPSQKISATHPPRHDRRESLRGDRLTHPTRLQKNNHKNFWWNPPLRQHYSLLFGYNVSPAVSIDRL